MTTASLDRLVVGYLGNFEPPHSTENHVAAAFESHGVKVLRLQENASSSWQVMPHLDVDLIVWTRTWSLPAFAQRDVLDLVAKRGTPVVGFHLDRWWGLSREHEVETEPFFAADLMITADGGHDALWAAAGIRHRWLPPAVSGAQAASLGRREGQFVRPLAFVGSHDRYHAEWAHRRELVEWAKRTYGRSLGLWPAPGRGAVRGRELANLYASVDIVLGDSCLAGGATHYWSDRIPETLGRGGFLLHPDVVGLEDHFEVGQHLVTWPLGDFDRLGRLVEYYLRHPDDRRRIAAAGRAHVLEHHTYEHRVVQLIDIARDEGLL